MNTLSTKQIDTIERYLLNQLSDDERNEFEVAILEDPELFEEVQRQEAFISTLKNEKVSLAVTPPAKSGLSFLQWIMQPYSLASSMALAVSVFIILNTSSPFSVDSRRGTSGVLAVASSLTLETLRGQENQFISSGKAPILLTIDVGPISSDNLTNHSVSLVDQTNEQETFTSGTIQADNQGWLKVIVEQDLIGEFRIDVTELGSGQISNSYLVSFTE